jgi:hypothetical protein
MTDHDPDKAKGFIFSMYPSEHSEILRIMQDRKFRTPFDVVRWALRKCGEFKEARVRK